MGVIDTLGDVGRALFGWLIVGLPLLAWQWVVLSSRPGRGSFGLIDITLIAGAMVGLAGLAVVIPPGALAFDTVVASGGLWDLSLAGFLRRAGVMAARAVPAMIDMLQADDEERDLRVWLSLAGVLWLSRLALGLVRQRPNHALVFLLAETATFVASVYGTLYTGVMLIWLVNQMNVWILLLLLLLLQDFRHNDPPLLARLTAATGSFALFARYTPPQPKGHGGHH